MDPDSNGSFDQLVEDVVLASRVPPKLRSTKIKPTVAELNSLAYENGVPASSLNRLIDLTTTPNLLDQASLTSIIRHLYPVEKVNQQAVTSILSCFGHGKLKASLNIQAAFLKWLVLVYHVLERPGLLSRAYALLFNLLETAAIRNQVAHLLALITRRKHVLPFRIQALLDLSRRTGNDPSLVGLLRVYKDYYPEIIVGSAVRGKAAAFKNADPEWRGHLGEIQDKYRQNAVGNLDGPRDGFKVFRSVNRGTGSKLIPSIHTTHALMDSITLEEIENANDLVQNIEKLELPNQLVAVLSEPLLQKIFLLRPQEASHQRLAMWLHSTLQDVLDGSAEDDTLWELLDVLQEFVLQTKVIPPILLDFFVRFLPIWDGSGRPTLITVILSFVPLDVFGKLYEQVFQHVEAVLMPQGPETQLAIMDMYTAILMHWTSVAKSQESSGIPNHTSKSIVALARHFGNVALLCLQTTSSSLVEGAILDHYEQMLRLVMDPDFSNRLQIELPPPSLVYLLLLSNSIATMSRLCNVLATCKKIFESAMQARSQGKSPASYTKSYVSLYNGFLLDACNCLWRSKAFSDADASSHGCLVARPAISALTAYIPSVDRSFALASLFSLSYSPILCLQSTQRLRKLEEDKLASGGSIETRHAGPANQASLAKLGTSGGIQMSWQTYRIEVLNQLNEQGLPGISELLKNTMIVLKKAMEGNK